MSDTANLALPNKTTAPPGGWRYIIPETNQEFRAHSESQLLAELAASYKINGYPMPSDLPSRIEYFVCAHNPSYCVDRATNAPLPKYGTGLAHTLHNVLQFTRTMGTWLAKSRTFVSQEQADRRAKTCASCQFNATPDGCTGCNMSALREAVTSIVGARRTAVDDHLKSCVICACVLKSKVWFPHNVLWPHMTEVQKERLPAHCWLNTEQAD